MEESPFYIGNFSQSGREDLEDLEFSDQVHAVGMGAFYACPNLSRVVLNKNLNYISPLAFAECSNLREVAANSNIIALAQNAFARGGERQQDQNAPQSENRSQDRKAAALEPAQILLKNPSYKLEGGLLYNAKWRSILFAQDKNLRAIDFPKNTKTIGWWAFDGMAALEEVDIPQTVEWIGERAFSNCPALKTVTLTKSVRQIEQAAFMNCSALEEFKLPKGLEEIAPLTFSGCVNLRSVEIPLSVRSIGAAAFEFCARLEKVTVSKWCEIEDGAFDKGVEVHRL